MTENFSKLEWEDIERYTSYDNTYSSTIRRAKISGGWLIQSYSSIKSNPNTNPQSGFGIGNAQGLGFIPDPNHEWVL